MYASQYEQFTYVPIQHPQYTSNIPVYVVNTNQLPVQTNIEPIYLSYNTDIPMQTVTSSNNEYNNESIDDIVPVENTKRTMSLKKKCVVILIILMILCAIGYIIYNFYPK